MAKLKIGIVGCGAIGSSLAKAIVQDFSKDTQLVAVYDLQAWKAQKLVSSLSLNKSLSVNSLKVLIARSQLVIEAASAGVSWQVAREALSKGRDTMIMSIGGLISHFDALSALAKKYRAKVYLPSGAISGIDTLKAARLEKIKSVTLITRKNPRSFSGVEYLRRKKINLSGIKKDTVLFSGSATEAVKNFPQNINVAALLSIAGIGENKTQVKIIATPGIKKNIHEIEIDCAAAKIKTHTENILHPDNPKTSYLAVLAAIATLKQVIEPIKIGT